MKAVTGFVSVRKCGFSPEFSVTPWNATSFGGGGEDDRDDNDDDDYDDDDDNNNNNDNVVISVIDVEKSVMLLLHCSILFFCLLPFELNIRIFYLIYWFFLQSGVEPGCERLNLTYDEVSRVWNSRGRFNAITS
jgi:hypothetical protein